MNIRLMLIRAIIYVVAIVSIIAFLLLFIAAGSFIFEYSFLWAIYIVVVTATATLFFLGKLLFVEKMDLEKTKIDLTKSLKESEYNRARIEAERDKTATIISSFSDGLIILDEHNNIFSINPEARKALDLQ